jgi:hypothetical protein
VEWITKKAHNNTAVTQTELLNYCIATFGAAVTRRWVDSFMSRHAAELFETKSSSQEKRRLEASQVFLEAAIEGVQTHVQNACADLVFNLDQIGISEWEDWVKRKVIVPSVMRQQKIFHGIHHGLKHISVVTCISAGGDHMISFLVSCQATEAVVVRKLKAEGFRMGIDIILEKRDKPYMNAVLFHEYISTVLLPYIARVRPNPGLEHEPAVIVMDGCSVHIHDDTLQELAARRVKVMIFPPHTTNIFQSLDLSLWVSSRRGWLASFR